MCYAYSRDTNQVNSDKYPPFYYGINGNDEVYMREKYESLSVAALKELAKARGIKHVSAMKKSEVIEAMLAEDAREERGKSEPEQEIPQMNVQGHSVSKGSEEEKTEEKVQKKSDRTIDEAPAEKNTGGRDTTETGNSREGRGGRENGELREPRTAYESRENRGVRESRYSRENREAQEYRGSREMQEQRGSREMQEPRMNREMQEQRGSRETQEPRMNREMQEPRSSREAQEPRMNREMQEPRAGREMQEPRMNREMQEPRTARDSQEPRSDRPPMDLASLDSGIQVSGILEVMPDGYGFIRSDNYLPGKNDVYVSPSQIRRFGLKTGDIISGNTRIKAQQEKFSALLYLKTINGFTPAEAAKRYNFEDMTPVFPNQRLRMERGSREIAMRIVDLISPIGKGQRGMIVSPPKAGKTTLLKEIAKSILLNDPDMHLIILLIDERPEEVTDIKEAIQGDNVEVIYSTFDELPEHHKRVSEMVIERAKRLVEHQKNVTILLDSITRLARAYNLTVPPSGRTLSGGLDPAALHMPKRFFGAARNMREGGSLTVLATALVDTGSKMDDVVYEEFKGTGNMELVLDRKLSERRVFPAIDIQKSGTRREDLLFDPEEQEAAYIMRKALNGMKSDEAVENILNMFLHTRDNRELVQRVRRQKYI